MLFEYMLFLRSLLLLNPLSLFSFFQNVCKWWQFLHRPGSSLPRMCIESLSDLLSHSASHRSAKKLVLSMCLRNNFVLYISATEQNIHSHLWTSDVTSFLCIFLSVRMWALLRWGCLYFCELCSVQNIVDAPQWAFYLQLKLFYPLELMETWIERCVNIHVALSYGNTLQRKIKLWHQEILRVSAY